MTEKLDEIRKDLKKKLKYKRFEHTVGVMYTAASLAMCYGVDMQKALTAGLLHDCGKYCSVKEQLRLCEKYGIELTKYELDMPALIHAKLGACLAEHEYGISDREILDAVTYHTTGRPEMSMLEKIIYISDYIEPNRREIPGLSEIRKIVFQNIDRAVCLSARHTVRYLREAGNSIDPMTVRTYEFYKTREED